MNRGPILPGGPKWTRAVRPVAALYSGAFHPTAGGHVIVADHVLHHVDELLEKKSLAQN
jgi:hypothetical protein